MKHLLISFLTITCLQVHAQTNTYLLVRSADNISYKTNLDNTETISSSNQNVLLKNVSSGAHTLFVQLDNGNNISIPFATNNGQAIAFALANVKGTYKLLPIDVAVKNNTLIAFVPQILKTKKKSIFDKLLGESADGSDLKEFGLYKKGITDANKNEYETLQASNNKQFGAVEEVIVALSATIAPVTNNTSEYANSKPKQVEAPVATLPENKTEANNTKKKSKLLSFLTEPSRDNNEVKINRTTTIKKEEISEPIIAKADIKKETEQEKLAKLAAEKELVKQKQSEELAKQQDILLMKQEKIRLDAIAKEEKQAAEKIKFLELQKRKEQQEAEKLSALKIEQEKIETEKLKQEAAIAESRKAAEIAAKLKIAKKVDQIVSQSPKEIENTEATATKDKQRIDRIMKEASEAKKRLKKDADEKERLAKETAAFEKAEHDAMLLKQKQAEEEEKIRLAKLEKQQKAAQLAEEKKQTKLMAEASAKKVAQDAIDAKLQKLEVEKKLKQQKEAEILAAKLAEQKAVEAQKELAIKLKQDKKNLEEINAKKILVAQQAKKEEEKLVILKKQEQETARIAQEKEAKIAEAKKQELAKKEEEEKQALLLASQKDAEATVKTTEPTVNANTETLSKLDKKIIKVQNRTNSNCVASYTEDELVNIFQKLEMKVDDDSRIGYCKKLLKSNKCFTCKEVEQLAQSFSTQTGQFDFVKSFFPYIKDNQNYETLVKIFKYESYKQKIRMEFGGE